MQEIQINQALQKLSNPFLDAINLIFTEMGNEIFFFAVLMVMFWCVDKRYGFKMINVYLLGVVGANALKNVFVRPRPYTYPTVTSIGPKTEGYSFPSGHSASISNLATQAGVFFKKWQAWLIGGALTAIVMFTRLYLGQHFLTDVIAGSAIGVTTALMLGYLFDKLGQNEHMIFLVAAPLCVILVCVLTATGNQVKILYDACGGYLGVTLAYYLEKKYVRFNPKASLVQNFIKIGVGAVLVLAIKEGLKPVLTALGLTHLLVYSFLRYLIVAFVAILLLPFIFKKLKLEKAQENKADNA